jgi:hypothetical protein
VRAFRRQLRAHDERTLVLFGRCREREAVPYAGIDEVVDALSRFLVSLGASRLSRGQGMTIHAAADLLRGRPVGGEEGSALRDGAERAMREHGVANPSRMAAVILPSVDAL